MKIMITGPQGSGKTTQAKIIAEKLGICLVKTGDLVRQKALENDADGLSLRNSLATGQLSDDKVVGSLVAQALEAVECDNGFIMDGYPRRLSQLEVYDPKFDKVFYLELNLASAIERMKNRGREDDTPELIEERLRLFEEETGKVIDYYQKLGILIRIDGSQSIEKVTEDILAKVR